MVHYVCNTQLSRIGARKEYDKWAAEDSLPSESAVAQELSSCSALYLDILLVSLHDPWGDAKKFYFCQWSYFLGGIEGVLRAIRRRVEGIIPL